MFWRFGGYANISTIDTILDKPDFTLEELLDESDLIQELKQHNSKLIEYLREDSILEKLLEYVVAPRLEVFATPDDPADDESKGKSRLLPFSRPRASSRATDVTDNDEEEQEKRRNRYALVASEVLSSDTWSIYEALTENRDLIRKFWKFLERPAPLDPLQASYFTKVNESLFEKKTDDMMELLRSIPNVVAELLRHVECPMIMDLLLKIIALDRNEGGQGIVEWLFSKDIIPALLSCLNPKHSWVVQTAAGDFIKAIITISANASQNEQQCIGPNELTRQLVSEPCVEQLIGYMLGGGNPLTVGVGIVIEVIRKNNSDYDPDMGTESNQVPSSRDPIYLGYLLRLFARNVPKFMSLIMDGPAKKEGSESTFGEKLEPLGFDRFKTCELMAELLHCSNMGLLNEVGAQELISTRDAVRQRLRHEGRLGPLREDDQSADDLTMRMSHGAVHDEGRRFEVTNADDDGFEEVESSKEMSEDTSHEFVKAEDDITAAPPSSFIDKDEDDFVDEPLSSPRLSVGSDKINEQRFEDPDLVVAPLSPSKSKPAELAESAKFANPDSIQRTEFDSATREIDEHLTSTQQPTESSLSTSALPEPTPSGSSLNPSDLGDQHRGLSPHPEDTPAPLFSSASAPQSVALDQTAQKTEIIVHPPAASHPVHGMESSEQIADVDDPSAALGQQQLPQNINIPLEHVVGDFLKMQFVEHRVVPAILTFFFSYPWNNFLHNVVYDIVQQVFNGPMDRGYNPTLAVSLFEAADITTAIINGQQASDESQAKTKTRMGYMGHLTLIAEEVVKFTERHPPELLSEMVLDKVMSQEWINYVEGALAETRERDNAILGGVRPEVALGHRASIGGGNGLGGVGLSGLGGASATGSNALAEAGLNGGIEISEGSNNGIGPFAISAGTLMSGFGSSSDEEDDEGDVEEEDVNSEVSGDSFDDRSTGSPEVAANANTDSPVDVISISAEPFGAISGDSSVDIRPRLGSPVRFTSTRDYEEDEIMEDGSPQDKWSGNHYDEHGTERSLPS
ncbi:Extragenic suppressor of kinetochore protein 1 [Metarhizium brunneum]|uniref:Extragenic suppressor of kinetochore protein 1 n=1 Tax=Metarhizium brunneum TaxID=500148 RepID=A0A7D5Z0H3_9HYPO